MSLFVVDRKKSGLLSKPFAKIHILLFAWFRYDLSNQSLLKPSAKAETE